MLYVVFSYALRVRYKAFPVKYTKTGMRYMRYMRYTYIKKYT